MAFAASVTNISTSPASGCVAVGEPFMLNFRLNNTGTGTVQLCYLYLYKDGTFWELEPYEMQVHQLYFDGMPVNIAAGKNKAYALPLVMEDPGFGGDHITGCVLYAEIYHVESGQTLITESPPLGISALDMRYRPSVPVFSVRRDPTEESTGAAVGIRCTLAEGADPEYEGLELTLQWRERGESAFPGANRMAINIAQALSASGVTANPGYVFEAGKEYALRVTFTDGVDTAFSETILSKSFAVFDVSPDGHGFAVGQYATGTEQSPKFECRYPAHFYGGIVNLEHAHILGMLGVQSGEAGFPAQYGAKANAYTDLAVAFPAPYKAAPLLFLSVKTGSTAVNMGSHLYALLTDSLTASGFTVRWYNNTSTDRWPTICWTAMGELND